jgi:hypothetical protein
MSLVTGLITGFLNEDVKIRENQREYEAKLAEKKELARQAIAKEKRAWNQEQIKTNINQNYETSKMLLGKIAEGKIENIPNLTKMTQLNQASLRVGGPLLYDLNKSIKLITKEDEAATVFGSGENKISYGLELKKKLNYDNAVAFTHLLANQGNSEGFMKKIAKFTKDQKDEMMWYVSAAEEIFRQNFMAKSTDGAWNPQTTPKGYPYKYLTTGYYNVKRALGMAIEGPDQNNMLVNSHEKSLKEAGEQIHDTYFFTIENNMQIPFGMTIPEDLAKGFGKVTNKLSPDKNPKTTGMYFANVNAIKDVTGTLLKGNDIQNLFLRSVIFANQDSNNAVDPDRRLYRMTDKEVLQYHKLVYDGKVVSVGEIDKAAMVLMPSMLYPNEGVQTDFITQRSSMTFQNYAVNKIKGKQDPKDVSKISKLFGEMRTQRNETRDAIDDVIEIIKLTNDKNETDAFSKLRNFAYGTLSIEEGFLGDVLNAIFGSEENRLLKTDGSLYDNGKQALTPKFLKELEDGILEARGKDEIQGQLEALRISVAFKMARAADPSGRLSDQDIKLQLQKLGGANFEIPRVALRKLQTVLKDLKRGFKTLDVMVNYGASEDYMTANDQRYFDGIIAANELQNRMDRITYNVGKTKASQTTTFSTNPEDYQKPKAAGKWKDNVYVGKKDGKFYFAPENDFSKITVIPSGQVPNYIIKGSS